MHYEMLKHSGELPLIGINTFLNPNPQIEDDEIELARSTDEEKDWQIRDLERFQQFHAEAGEVALQQLRDAALSGGNTFEALMECARVCSLGQVTQELYQLGGQYRRNM